MLIRIITNWEWPDVLRQTPNGNGRWGDFQFTTDPVTKCDFVIVTNRVTKDITVECPPENVWTISQEPPVPEYRWLKKGYKQFARVYTPEIAFQGEKFIHSHGALPWHVDKSYDDLQNVRFPPKTHQLSWITSNKSGRIGHKKRLQFLKKLQKANITFDLWGRGFTPIKDKWGGIAPYRYSLAIENHSAPYYWTEKIADCFLGWSMPIYYGCTNIADYFPKESFVQIDISSPFAIEQIHEVISSDRWQQNLDAIKYARDLILEKYQFFPFFSEQIKQLQNTFPNNYPNKIIDLTAWSPISKTRLKKRFEQLLRKI